MKITKIFSKYNFKKVILFLLFIFIFATPLFFLNADNSSCDTSKGICNPISASSINELIKSVLEFAIKLGIPVIALAIIYSGFLFVKARGNSEELGKAKDALLYTVIGAAILLGSWAIAQLISETILSL